MNAHQLPASVPAKTTSATRPKLCLVDSQYLQRLASQERSWDRPHVVKSVAVKRGSSTRRANRAGAKDRVRGGAAASNVARCNVASSRPRVSCHAETGKSSVAQLVGWIEKLNTALVVLAVFIGVIGCAVIGVSALSASQSICTADLVSASQNNLPYCP